MNKYSLTYLSEFMIRKIRKLAIRSVRISISIQ